MTLQRPYKSPAFHRAPSINSVRVGPAVREAKRKGLVSNGHGQGGAAGKQQRLYMLCCHPNHPNGAAERQATTRSSSNGINAITKTM